MATQRSAITRGLPTDQDLTAALRLTLISALVVGAIDVACGSLLSLNGLTLTGVQILLYGAVVFVALGWSGRGHSRAAARLNAYALLVLAVGVVLSTPLAMPACLIAALAAPIFAVAHVDRDDLLMISGGSSITVLGVLLSERSVQLFPPVPEPLSSTLRIFSAVTISIIALILFWQIHGRLAASLRALQTANDASAAARDELAQKVAEQTADIEMALRELQRRADEQAHLLAENAGQRAMIAELSLPILPVSDEVLVMPLIGALDSARLNEARSQALRQIERRRARHLILDITGVPVIDTHVAAGLLQIVAAARLLGTGVILVGVRPEVAQTIVGLGLDLSDLTTLATLQSGLQYALRV